MSAGTLTGDRLPDLAAPERPSYGRILWRLLIGWFAAGIATNIAGLVAGSVAFGTRWPDDTTPVPWVARVDDAWSVAANAPIALLWLFLSVVCVRRMLAGRPGGLVVGIVPLTALNLAVFAFSVLPREHVDDGTAGAAFFALLVAAWVLTKLRWTPMERLTLPWRARIALAIAAVVALVGLPYAYGAVRPFDVEDPADCVFQHGCPLRDGRMSTVHFNAWNRSHEAVTVTSARLVGVAPGLRVAPVRAAMDATLPFRLATHRTISLDAPVRVPRGWCRRAIAAKALPGVVADGMALTFRRGGTTHTVTLDLRGGPRISCSGDDASFGIPR